MKQNKGFTLIELVLVISLLALSVGVSGDIIISLIRSYSKTQVTNEIEETANFLTLKLEKELRNAQRTSVPALGASGNTLTFLNRAGDTVTYALTAQHQINRTVSSGGSFPLTISAVGSGGVVIDCPGGCFTLIADSPQVVRLNINVKSGNSSPTFEGNVTLNNTIVVRGTY